MLILDVLVPFRQSLGFVVKILLDERQAFQLLHLVGFQSFQSSDLLAKVFSHFVVLQEVLLSKDRGCSIQQLQKEMIVGSKSVKYK